MISSHKPLLRLLVLSAAIVISGCGGFRRGESEPYQVGAGSAIFAGSDYPLSKTKASVNLYFGEYVVRVGGEARGCCYLMDHSSYSSRRPRGAVLAVWAAEAYGDEQTYSEKFRTWLPKPVESKYYYAVASASTLAPYPPRTTGHQSYRIFASAGKFVVSDLGLRRDAMPGANEFRTPGKESRRYVVGDEDTLYYKILSHAAGSIPVADDSSPWHAIRGIAITKDQYYELTKCDFHNHCRTVLSVDDPDLSPEQRAYVKSEAVSTSDFQRLIKLKESYRRWNDRWK